MTMADWSAAGDFEKAAKPGDLVDEEIVEEFVNCLPPTTLRGDLVQAGEPYSHQYDPEWKESGPTAASASWARPRSPRGSPKRKERVQPLPDERR